MYARYTCFAQVAVPAMLEERRRDRQVERDPPRPALGSRLRRFRRLVLVVRLCRNPPQAQGQTPPHRPDRE